MNRGLDISIFLKMAGDLVKPMKDAENKVKASTERMKKSMSLSLKVGGAGLAAQGIKMLTSGIVSDFTQSYKEVQRASGDLRSLGVKDMEAIIAEGQRMQGTYVGLTTEAFVRAAYDIRSGVSSLTDEGVAAMTASALTVSKATKGVPEEMTCLFATSYGIFKKQFSEMSDADWGDMFGAALSKSVQQFKTDGAKMQQAIESAGAGATNLGIDMTEQLTLLGMMQQQMQAGEAGTALRAFATNSAKAHEAFEGLAKSTKNKVRVAILDEKGELRAMPDILSDLKKRYGETLDAFEAAEIKKAFGTDEAMKMINALYGQEEAVRANEKALADAADQGAEFTQNMAENVDNYDGASWDLFIQQMDVIKQQIGAGLLPAMDKLAPIFGSMATSFGNFASNNPAIIAGFGAVVVGLGGIATVAAPVLFGISSLVTVFGGLRHGSVLLGLVLGGTDKKAGLLARGTKVSAGGFGILKVAVMAVGRAMLANPIGLAIAVIAGGAYLIIKHWEPIKAFFSRLWDTVKSYTTVAWEGIKNIFFNYTPLGLIFTHWDSVAGWFTGLWGRVKSGTVAAWESIKSGFLNYTPHGLIITHWDSIAGWFTGLWGRVKSGTAAAWEGIKSGFLNYTPHGLIITHWDSIAGWFTGLWGRVKSGTTAAWAGIKTTLAGYAPASMFSSTWDGLSSKFTGIWQGVSTATTVAWDGIKSGFLNYTPHGLIITHWDQISAYFVTLWQGVGTTFTTQWEAIKATTAGWAADFLTIGGDIIDGLKAGITAKIESVVETIGGVGARISSKFKSVLGIESPSKVFSGFGGDIMSGLIGGIKAKLQALRETITSVASKAAGWFKSKLGINSPSRVVMGFGGNLSEGLAIGIDKAKERVFSSLNNIRKGIALPMMASAAIGTVASAGAGSIPSQFGAGDLGGAPAQIASMLGRAGGGGAGKTVSLSPTYQITLGGDVSEELIEKIRQMLIDLNREQQLELESLLND